MKTPETGEKQVKVAGRYETFIRDYTEDGMLIDASPETIQKWKEEFGHYWGNMQLIIFMNINEIEQGYKDDKSTVIDPDDVWANAIVKMLRLILPAYEKLTKEEVDEAERFFLTHINEGETVSDRKNSLIELRNKLEKIGLL